jgi:type II secretory pathway component PulK
MSRRRNAPHGLALVLAITMLALVSAALVVLTTHFGFELQRTQLSTQDAQLRELLAAGAQEAVADARQWPQKNLPRTWQMNLPTALIDEKAMVSLESVPAKEDSAEVHIEARLAQRAAFQTLHFHRMDGKWAVQAVEWGN